MTGARLLLGGRLEEAVLRIEDGRIAAIEGSEGAASGARLDGRGCLLLPGIVDLHGDAFERSLMPRPGVHFPPEIAFDEADRIMAGFGITTALHGVTYSWEPGLRGRETFLALAPAFRRLRGSLRCDTHLHLRFEVQNHEGLADVAPLIADGTVGVVAFNDHLEDIEGDLAVPEKAARYPARTGLPLEDFRALMRRVGARGDEIAATVTALAGMAAAAGVPLLSHDDADLATRARYRALGARLAEFPLAEAVAADARAEGEHVVMGGPNVLRGGSHKAGNPSAAELAASGLCSVLTSDYYYPAPLHAAFKLAQEGVLPFGQSWDLVSANPAEALGLADRGRIEPGRRADLLLVRPEPRPDVVATLVEGRRAFVSTGG
ncbi:alpha-D-ribose 1-methylphosphonate 5-triphosphate diphosphatase [Tistlia consotensis]|uniref:Alpha-D-ribose 1-methylphosphonate 5-triphosphate diphosphatase n=1 Tax=Tistlia consotensis USBA 355 TaxID=560819 RepID=A0A1Y6CHC7_9PROT|nr:alpha-D-ribose 1-methylphosphonate 5-triphosphate diphosphatase [Tistlia consotensis]SMF65384.1 alpha-D-ribose 1-methylphosphonate 5-triphosphate diphosphatase [Tistlia consotensis USBA 355]SNS03760.1 alpha-D-ribose 1-methylphosphonate 5-triphosphate diphosphatase [Tistlia consotensis]